MKYSGTDKIIRHAQSLAIIQNMKVKSWVALLHFKFLIINSCEDSFQLKLCCFCSWNVPRWKIITFKKSDGYSRIHKKIQLFVYKGSIPCQHIYQKIEFWENPGDTAPLTMINYCFYTWSGMSQYFQWINFTYSFSFLSKNEEFCDLNIFWDFCFHFCYHFTLF